MEDEIREIIREFKEGDDEPLDGDAVDVLANLIRGRINEIEGNT